MRPEDKKLHEERHQQLIESIKRKFPNDQYPHVSEAMWEHTLGEITGGKYDMPLGIRLFFGELMARIDRQAFIDEAAVRLCQIARNGTNDSDLKHYAQIAYRQAAALWNERQVRRNSGRQDEEIPF